MFSIYFTQHSSMYISFQGISRYISFQIKPFHGSVNKVITQIKNIQTFRTVQVLNLDKKQKDISFPFYILLQVWSSSKFMVQWRSQEYLQGTRGMWCVWLWVSAVFCCRYGVCSMMRSWACLKKHVHCPVQVFPLLRTMMFVSCSLPSFPWCSEVTNLRDIAGDKPMVPRQSGLHLCHCDQG